MNRCIVTCLLATAIVAAEQAPLSVRLSSGDHRELTRALVDLAHDGLSAASDLDRARTAIADPDPSVRLAAMGAVAKLHDDAAVPLLAEAMRSSDGAVATNAHSSLVAIVGRDVGQKDPEAWRAWDAGMSASTRASVDRFHGAVDKGDEEAARAIIHPLLMQRAGRDIVVEALVRAADSGNPRLALLAREGLANIQTASAKLALSTITAGARPVLAGEASSLGSSNPPIGPAASAVAAVGLPASVVAPARDGWLIAMVLAGVAGISASLWWACRRGRVKAVEHWTRVFVLRAKDRVRRGA